MMHDGSTSKTTFYMYVHDVLPVHVYVIYPSVLVYVHVHVLEYRNVYTCCMYIARLVYKRYITFMSRIRDSNGHDMLTCCVISPAKLVFFDGSDAGACGDHQCDTGGAARPSSKQQM